MSGYLGNDVELGPEGEPMILSMRLMMLKAGTIEMIQIDPLKSPTNGPKTLTIVLMIYGPCSESKLRVMMKHG